MGTGPTPREPLGTPDPCGSGRTPGSLLEAVLAELSAPSPAPSALLARTHEFLTEHGVAGLSRDGGARHLTASCVVFDPSCTRVLLHHHRKADLWGQFGGHLEPGDPSLRAAARRETEEESGLAELLWFSPVPVDVHWHDLPGAFGSCRTHLDVVYAAMADPRAEVRVSAESLDVAWSRLDALPESIMPDLPDRLPGLARRTLTLREG